MHGLQKFLDEALVHFLRAVPSAMPWAEAYGEMVLDVASVWWGRCRRQPSAREFCVRACARELVERRAAMLSEGRNAQAAE